MSEYWKFNISLLDEKDFQDHLLLALMQELPEAVVGSKQWARIKDVFRLFAAVSVRERHKKLEEKVL